VINEYLQIRIARVYINKIPSIGIYFLDRSLRIPKLACLPTTTTTTTTTMKFTILATLIACAAAFAPAALKVRTE
jgi:hypothetical protein